MTFGFDAYEYPWTPNFKGTDIYVRIAAKQNKDFGYLLANPSKQILWSYVIYLSRGGFILTESRPYIVPAGSNGREVANFVLDVVTVGQLFTIYKVSGLSGPEILAAR